MACKAYDKNADGDKTHIEEILLDAYSRHGRGRVRISKLFDSESQLAKDAPDRQMMLQLSAEEFMDEVIENEQELQQKITEIAGRFVTARDAAIEQHKALLINRQ